mmetsp:Transcript_12634/g.21738  ORF Transcript_12634/g.21738 Transcript_12634/m.21738 type:complete len:380 (+) Transcript_12634:260-1399(+)
MQFSLQIAATVLALATAQANAFEIENPTTDTWTSYTAQEEITVGGTGVTTIVASGGPSGIASGNCTFTTGTTDSWSIKTDDGTTSVNGCYNVSDSGSESTSLPRASFDADSDPTAFDSTDMWCYIGEVNDGSSNSASAGLAIYNGKSANEDKWDEWAYCSEETDGETTYQYVSIAGYSKADESHNEAGYPCAGTWNYNNNTNGNGGVAFGVASSCLPFADYKPNTEGLDLSNVPDYEQKYWCFLEQGDGTLGYNPNQMSDGEYTDKTYEWGFCEDTTDPYTAAPTASPGDDSYGSTESTEAPTEAPTEEGETGSPTSETTSAPSAAPTASPVADGETGSPTVAPTAATTNDAGSSDSPSGAANFGVPMLLATAVAALAF